MSNTKKHGDKKRGTKWNRDAIPFYDKAGNVRLKIPARMTIADMVAAGMPMPRMIPNNEPWTDDDEVRTA